MKIYCVEETDGYEGFGRVYFTKREDAEACKAEADKSESVTAGYWFNVIHEYDLNETFNPTVA
jgi:hypothetical protein